MCSRFHYTTWLIIVVVSREFGWSEAADTAFFNNIAGEGSSTHFRQQLSKHAQTQAQQQEQ